MKGTSSFEVRGWGSQDISELLGKLASNAGSSALLKISIPGVSKAKRLQYEKYLCRGFKETEHLPSDT